MQVITRPAADGRPPQAGLRVECNRRAPDTRIFPHVRFQWGLFVGTFSSMFMGNGFTYTGNRGLLTPTATEYIASPFNVSELPPDAKVDIFFCINGLNSGRMDAQGTCPIPQRAQAADAPGGLVARDSALPLYSLLTFLLHCLLVHIGL